MVFKEKKKNIKTHFTNYGSTFTYWLSQYCTDIIINIVPQAVGPILAIYILQKQLAYVGKTVNTIAELYIVLLISTPPFIYVIAYAFKKEQTASLFLLAIYVIHAGIGTMLNIAINININILSIVEQIFMLIHPMSAIAYAISYITNQNQILLTQESQSQVNLTSPTTVVYLSGGVALAEGVFCIIFLILVELRVFSVVQKFIYLLRWRQKCCKKKDQKFTTAEQILQASLQNRRRIGDSPVKGEKSVINKKIDRLCKVQNITKQYFSPICVALKNISFEILKGDCIGFIGCGGPNSGYTTLIRSLSNIFPLSHGYINRYGNQFGYCLDETKLEQNLTVRQIFQKFSTIHAIPKSQREDKLFESLSLVRMQDKHNSLVKTLTPVEQKKIKIALALQNDPQLLFLDEPFAGLDQLSKRSMIRVLFDFINTQKKAIVFTSKSYQDVQKYCNKIGIIHNGKLLAYSTLEGLQEAYGEAKFELNAVIRVQSDAIEQIKFEHNYKKKLKVQQDNFSSILEQLKMTQLLNGVMMEYDPQKLQQQPNTVKEMRDALINDELVLIDNFLEWAITEHQAIQFEAALKVQYKSVVLKERMNNMMTFHFGKSIKDDLKQSCVIEYIEKNKMRFNIVEYSIMKISLDSIIKNIYQKEICHDKNLKPQSKFSLLVKSAEIELKKGDGNFNSFVNAQNFAQKS